MRRYVLVLVPSFLVAFVACTSDGSSGAGASSSTSSSGGSSSAAASSSGGSSSGGSSSGGSSSGGSSSGDDAGSDASSSGGGTGAAALGGGDGITAVFGGTTHTCKEQAIRVPQQTQTAVIGAKNFTPYETWSIRFKPQVGSQDCTASTGTDDTFISYGSADFNALGTTAKPGSCTINVTSVAPKLEGSFTATLATEGGMVQVTDGYFRINAQ